LTDDTLPPAPYPDDTESKGWRFELHMEKVKKSDTWLRAKTGRLRGALLLLWSEAWEQTPCGSLPDDDELLMLLLDMTADEFDAQRSVLMRGWWRADDGRLYHDTITERVLAMLEKRASDAKRSHDKRVRDAALKTKPKRVTKPSRVTHTGDTPASPVSSPPSTKHQAPVEEGVPPSSARGGEDPPPDDDDPPCDPRPATQAGQLCRRLRDAGMADTNPGHPELLALLDAGATAEEFVGFVTEALGKSKPFAYLLATVAGTRERAAATAMRVHRGPMPNRQEALEARNRAVGRAWLREQEEHDANR